MESESEKCPDPELQPERRSGPLWAAESCSVNPDPSVIGCALG
jgi:hypothetical protein